MLAIIMSIENESDRSFVEYIYVTHGERMYAAVFSILQHHHDTEDCVHDMIAKIIEYLDKFKDAHEKGYLVQLLAICCRNIAINKYKENRIRGEMEYSTTMYTEYDEAIVMDIPDIEANVERIVLSEYTCEYIKSLIDKLKPIYRDVLIMKARGWENDEIAHVFGISVDLVRKRHSRARAKIIEMGGEQLYGR